MHAETEEWERAEWSVKHLAPVALDLIARHGLIRWKLAMCPDHILPKDVDIPISIPAGVDIDQIFKDQLAYIKKNVETYISDAYSQDADFWNDDSSIVEIILTTPNGWSGMQQQRIREAAVAARLVPPQESKRVRFVSEGEVLLFLFLKARRPTDSFYSSGCASLLYGHPDVDGRNQCTKDWHFYSTTVFSSPLPLL